MDVVVRGKFRSRPLVDLLSGFFYISLPDSEPQRYTFRHINIEWGTAEGPTHSIIGGKIKGKRIHLDFGDYPYVGKEWLKSDLRRPEEKALLTVFTRVLFPVVQEFQGRPFTERQMGNIETVEFEKKFSVTGRHEIENLECLRETQHSSGERLK